MAVCLNISTVLNIKILTNSNQQTQSYEFTSHIAAFLSGFDHRDAWNLHTHIIWSKRSTDFKELSPCSVWYPLKLELSNLRYSSTHNTLQVLQRTVGPRTFWGQPCTQCTTSIKRFHTHIPQKHCHYIITCKQQYIVHWATCGNVCVFVNSFYFVM